MTVARVLGLLLVLIGAVWTLQGLGLIGGSFMTGSTMWLVIGLVVAVVGVLLLVRRRTARR
jgi:glucose dehydrogenase